MIKTSLVNRIEKMFLEEKVTMKKLYKVTNTNTEEQLSNVLFDFINVKLDNCHDCESILYLADVFSYVPTISAGDRDKFPRRKVQKLYEKIDRLLEIDCQRIGYYAKYPWQLTKIKKELESKEESVLYNRKPKDETLSKDEIVENKKFKLVTTIIDKVKNLKYLENTLKAIPNIVNSKNENGQSLYFRYAKKYF